MEEAMAAKDREICEARAQQQQQQYQQQQHRLQQHAVAFELQTATQRAAEADRAAAARVESLQQEIQRLKELSAEAAAAALLQLQRVLGAREVEAEDLRQQILDLEARLHANDKSVQLELLRRGCDELRVQLQQQTEKAQALQEDSLLLEKARAEAMDVHMLVSADRALPRSHAVGGITTREYATESTLRGTPVLMPKCLATPAGARHLHAARSPSGYAAAPTPPARLHSHCDQLQRGVAHGLDTL
ncbi:pre-mRNA-splicing regulator female-lethal(2)D [Cyclospora cayetanensis]|uniref:Pre-mRNA-splicing regulator female-lethal(2)D n=1 Tax=Cyclospora cayetanensis TaxID=88456 RepID=A0A6P6RW96_9EIME|nr:pre-mRNA-splicing regulator female-lethal(2)D [Cyclospora cayetanensis]